MKRLFLISSVLLLAPWLPTIAAPTLEATNTSVEAANTTTHTVSLPSSVAAGDLIGICFAYENDEVSPNPSATGYTQLVNTFRDPGASLAVFHKTATGGETTASVTTTESVQSAHYTFRISGWTGSPEAQTSFDISTNPDPPSITPSGGADDYFIQTCVAIDEHRDFTVYPSGYTNTGYLNSHVSSADAVTIAYASKGLTSATTEDPGQYTTQFDDWRAVTISVAPDASPTLTLSDATPDIDTTVTATLSGAFGAGGNPTTATLSTGDTVACSSATSTTCQFPLNYSALVASGDLGATKLQTALTITVTNGTETSQSTAINIQVPASGYAIVDLTCTAGTDCTADSEAIPPMIAGDDCAIKVLSGTLDQLSTHCAPVFLTSSFSYIVARFDESAVAWLAQETAVITAPVKGTPKLKIKGVRMGQ